MNNILSGSEIIIKSLLLEGVEYIFGYPGGAIMPIYDVLYKYSNSLCHVLSRHEQGAIHAAQGYSRVTGKVGVCLATSGPGATNLVTGLADALMDSTPIVCVTGQVSSYLLGSDAFQEIAESFNEIPKGKDIPLVNEIEIWKKALNNIMPHVEVRSRRIGGSTFQIPMQIKPERKISLAIKWLIFYARYRSEKNMSNKLANEILLAYKEEGAAVKKRRDTHKMAVANKAFSHFRL